MPDQDFYPQHYRKTRPYTKPLIEALDALRNSHSLVPNTAYNASAQHIINWYRSLGVAPGSPQFDSRKFTVENQAALMYGEWVGEGSALYALEPALVEALKATGLSEVSLADIKYPFECAYIHFGAQPDMVLQSGAAVTGAYLLLKGSLRVSLTAPLTDVQSPIDRALEVYDLRIPEKHLDKDLETAIECALADDVEDLRNAQETIMRQPHGELGAAAAQAFLDSHMANHAVFAKCLQLIANVLCYVTAYPEDTKYTWQAGTPEKMRLKADTAPPKEAARATSKLNAMGYRKVQYIGGEFAAASEKSGARGVSPHWRRGHWRNQRYGPGLSLTKLKWLLPTRVLGGHSSEEPRVYKADLRPSDKEPGAAQ